MDLSGPTPIELEDNGAWMTILDLAGNETDARLRLAGSNSKIAKKIRFEYVNRTKGSATAEQSEAALQRLVAACTLEVENLKLNGVAVTPETIGTVYKAYPYLFAQANTFIHDESNFVDAVAVGK